MVGSIRQPTTGDHRKYSSDALRTARETVLDGDQLRRAYPRPPRVPRTVVLVTGGPSDDPRTTAAEAAVVRDLGVHVFAVGVGPSVDRELLERVASRPSNDFTYLVDDADGLESVAEQLAASICSRKSVIYRTSIWHRPICLYWPISTPYYLSTNHNPNTNLSYLYKCKKLSFYNNV